MPKLSGSNTWGRVSPVSLHIMRPWKSKTKQRMVQSSLDMNYEMKTPEAWNISEYVRDLHFWGVAYASERKVQVTRNPQGLKNLYKIRILVAICGHELHGMGNWSSTSFVSLLQINNFVFLGWEPFIGIYIEMTRCFSSDWFFGCLKSPLPTPASRLDQDTTTGAAKCEAFSLDGSKQQS